MPIIKISGAKGAGKTTALEAQNAELLTALKVMLEVFGDEFGPGEFESVDLARAVVAKATNPVEWFDLSVCTSAAGFLAQELAQRFPNAFIYYSVEGE